MKADVEAVAAMHVRRPAQFHPVELDRGHRVESGADQVDPVVGAVVRERRLVHPVGPADPGEAGLVLVEERVGDEAGGEQVGVHTAGHGGRDGRHIRPGQSPA
jgi:hypothetical protein